MNRHDGGFIDDNTLASDEHQRIRRAQVDREVIQEFLGPALEQHHPSIASRSTTFPVEAPVLLSHRPSCQAVTSNGNSKEQLFVDSFGSRLSILPLPPAQRSRRADR